MSRIVGNEGGFRDMTETVESPGMQGQLFMRVDDAARILGISRSLAYDMVNLWIVTNGAEGLPAVRLGRRLLVKRSALEQWADKR